MNWNITKKNANPSWRMNGSATTNRAGASTIPSHTGCVWKIRPRHVLRANRTMKALSATNTGTGALAGGTFTFGGRTPQPLSRATRLQGGPGTAGAALAVGAP